MIHRLILCIFLFSTFFPASGIAENPEPFFRHFTTEDGLPSSQVYEAMQDADGYMWFATDRGLVKYNGYEFKTFTAKDGLTDNVVFRLFQDRKKRIWMITFSGCIFIYENNKITAFKYNYKVKDLLKGSFQVSIYTDSLENFFVSNTSGLYVIDRNGSVTQRFKYYGMGKINKLIIDQKITEENPIATGVVLDKFNKTDLFNMTNSGTDSIRIATSAIGRIEAIRLKSGRLLVAIGNILYEFKNKTLQPLTTLSAEIMQLVETPAQELWVCTKKGVYLFPKQGTYTEFYHYLKSKYIAGITEDQEGGYWISTIDDGVYYLVNSEVKNYVTDQQLKSPLTLTCSKSDVYAGYFSGSLAMINTNDLRFIFNAATDKYIDCIFYDTATARLYIGNNSLCYLENDKAHHLKTTTGKISNIGFVKHKQNIYSGAFSSIIKIAGDSSHREIDFPTRLNCIYSTEQGDLLLGCIDGAYRYDEVHNNLSLVSPQLKDVRVDDIESMEGHLCFATQGNGIMVLQNNGTFNTIDVSKGLCSNIIRKFKVNGNKIWCASFNGMSEIIFTDVEKFKFNVTSMTTNEGLLSNEINDITTLNDTTWVASKKGISFFNSNTDFVNHTPPVVHFTSFQVNGIDTTFSDNQLFPHTLNTISIGFESPLFKSSGKQPYQYILADDGDSIKGTTTNRSIQFLSLKPGSYSLHIKAMNNSGVWSAQAATLHFIIRAPWWQTGWFMLLVSMVIAATGISFYKIRLKKLNEKFSLERKQASLQLTAMRAQMNPHFIFNVMSSIRNYMQHNDMASAEKYLTSFAKLVRYTLDNSAIQEVTLEEELQAVRSYAMLEMQRVECGFDFDIKCEDSIDATEIMLPSLLLQPFVENAIKHGIERLNKRGSILIEIKKQESALLIAIEDNGVGRIDASKWNDVNRQKHTSLGSRLTFDRIDFFNKAYNTQIKIQVIDLANSHNNSSGTRVEIVL